MAFVIPRLFESNVGFVGKLLTIVVMPSESRALVSKMEYFDVFTVFVLYGEHPQGKSERIL